MSTRSTSHSHDAFRCTEGEHVDVSVTERPSR